MAAPIPPGAQYARTQSFPAGTGSGSPLAGVSAGHMPPGGAAAGNGGAAGKPQLQRAQTLPTGTGAGVSFGAVDPAAPTSQNPRPGRPAENGGAPPDLTIPYKDPFKHWKLKIGAFALLTSPAWITAAIDASKS